MSVGILDRPAAAPVRAPFAAPAVATEAERRAILAFNAARLAVLGLAAGLFLWQLGRNGFANDFYSAAALAASQSWKAFFFGAFDSAAFITVDKPPLALWVMGISVRLFGLNTWSILVPNALAGIASVALVMHLVRRYHGRVAAILAGLALALTPVAVAMFRFNNPDAILTLLMILAAWATLRATERGSIRWLLLSAFFAGLAFIDKSLQADLVVPGLVLCYFVAAPGKPLKRLGQLALAGLALIVASGWWMAIVDLIPASARPYVGGSTNNTEWDLIFGYNGLGRITGQGEGGPRGRFGAAAQSALTNMERFFSLNPATGQGGPGFGGAANVLRMFNPEVGGQIAWLLPLAIVGLAAGLCLSRRAPRADMRRASYILWGGWLLVDVLVFSAAEGIFHAYYTVAMAPAVAALAGAGAVDLWGWRRRSRIGGPFLAVTIAGSALLANLLLARTPAYVSWLGPAVAGLGLVAAVFIVVPSRFRASAVAARVGAGLALVALVAGPGAYSVYSAGHVEGGMPSGGPSPSRAGAFRPGANGAAPGLPGPGATGPRGTRFPGGAAAAAPGPGFPPPQFAGGPAPAQASTPGGQALVTFLEQHQQGATWLVATRSAQEGAPIELASGRPVLAMGGFNGGDQAMTVDRLQALVTSGQLRYALIAGRGPGGPGGPGGGTSAVTAWIQQHGTPVDYGATGQTATLYELQAS
ncbi:MAG: glycosyltransferase family 39 protein [Chloroflexi bacterium]|nr:glycosyltransferase family 39 protein [Chloroflexota bacterium]